MQDGAFFSDDTSLREDRRATGGRLGMPEPRKQGKEAQRRGKCWKPQLPAALGSTLGPPCSAHGSEPPPPLLPLHPGPSWQMLLPELTSSDEMKGKSDLPLIGLTVGN